MSITIKDIASACGVSKATVSRFLNQSGYVSAEASEKIKAKVEELNYVPSETARSLSTKNSNVIGVVIPEVSNPFFAEIFKGISRIADIRKFNILYCDTDNDVSKELKTLSMLRTYNVAGLIITPASNCSVIDTYEKDFISAVNRLNIPVLLLDRDIESANLDGVFTDNYIGAFDCTKLLLNSGHKKVATITGDTNFLIGRQRYKGYLDAISDSGLKVDKKYIYKGDFTTDTAYEITKKIMSGDSRPTGIFSPNNLTTIGILKALFESGYRVPDDISLVSFDNIDLLTTLNIKLSVVQRDPEDMGRIAMELLMEKIEGLEIHNKNTKIIIEPKVILRGSEKLVES